MALPKWKVDELLDYKERGYWVVPCLNADEAVSVKDKYKSHGKCAQAGRIINKENQEVFFVLVKDYGAKKGDKLKPVK